MSKQHEVIDESRLVVSVIGADRPGIVAQTTRILTDMRCNICEMSQHILHGQFACILVIDVPKGLPASDIEQALVQFFEKNDPALTVACGPYFAPRWNPAKCETFVISVFGPDRNDIITEFSALCAKVHANVLTVRACPMEGGESIQVLEVAVPETIDIPAWHKELQDKAYSMNLQLAFQHSHLFEAIHRI